MLFDQKVKNQNPAKMKTEIIIKEAFLQKLQDAVSGLKRNIKITDKRLLPGPFKEIKNYLVTLESEDTESIFFAGVAFGIPEKTKMNRFIKMMKSWVIRLR